MGDLPWAKCDHDSIHNCNNCHFLAKIKNPKHGGPTEPESWSEDERQYGWLTKDVWNAAILLNWRKLWTPVCYKGIWKMEHLSGPDVESDDVYDDEESVNLKDIADWIYEDRGERCFFIEYTKGMQFDTASELHRIRYDHYQLQRNYRYTVTGLFFAGAAIVANVILELYKLFRSP